MAEAAKCLNARKPGLNAADCSRREMRGCTEHGRVRNSVCPLLKAARSVTAYVGTSVSNNSHIRHTEKEKNLSFCLYSLPSSDIANSVLKER